MATNSAAISGKGFSAFHRIYDISGYLLLLGVQYCFLAFFSIASILAGMKVYTYIFQASYFSVTDVEISGLDKLTEEEILNSSGVELGKNTFGMDLEKLSESIMENPWVGNVMVRRELPKRLIIEIVERTPFAKVFSKERLFLIDDKGFVMDEVENHEYRGLPIIGGIAMQKSGMEGLIYPKIFMTGINLLKFARETRMFDIPIVGLKIDNRNEMTLVSQGRQTEIRFSATNIPEQLSRLEAIFDYAKMEGKTIEKIDLCLKKRAVVTFSD